MVDGVTCFAPLLNLRGRQQPACKAFWMHRRCDRHDRCYVSMTRRKKEGHCAAHARTQYRYLSRVTMAHEEKGRLQIFDLAAVGDLLEPPAFDSAGKIKTQR